MLALIAALTLIWLGFSVTVVALLYGEGRRSRREGRVERLRADRSTSEPPPSD